jgi:1-deoxy-D-xylulose-5-phosphate synthase
VGELLSRIDGPEDLRKLSEDDLPVLCREIREFLLTSVFETGGHLATNLGSVELTVALHYVFDFLADRLVWDVGHQAYTHKIITGRRDRFTTQRLSGGLSGFTNPLESPYDHFMGGHAGTSISQGLGLAVGSALKGRRRKTVVVIGDASIGAGMAFEALNMAGVAGADMLVVLNDNRMSISRTVGALAGYLAKIRSMPLYAAVKRDLQIALASLPLVGDRVRRGVDRAMASLRHYIVPGHIFEDLGIKYFGPFDGHDTRALVRCLRSVRRHRGPALLHLITEKGKGFDPAEADPVKYHGVAPMAVPEKLNGPGPAKPAENLPSWTAVFGDALVRLGERDPRVVAITAAMSEGTGTDRFQKRFPERFLDVGICEQHAVGMASGLAREGLLPVVAIYSTFLQRAYDQIFHDVLLNGRPVIFCLDRGGLVGADGWSHHGLYDIAWLRTLPGITLLSPRCGEELEAMLDYAARSGEVCAIRYPRGNVPAPFADPPAPIEKGCAEVLRHGPDGTIAAYGHTVWTAWQAAEALERKGISVGVVNARFAAPMDHALFGRLAASTPFIVTIEEAALAGGFGSAVLEALEGSGAPPVRVVRLGVPSEFVDHSDTRETLARLGLDVAGVTATVERLVHEKAGHPTWR